MKNTDGLALIVLLCCNAPAPAFAAEASISCSGGKTISVSVDGGKCTVSEKAQLIMCENKGGDNAIGYCNDEGMAKCSDSEGSGKCHIALKIKANTPRTLKAPPSKLRAH